jgi:hypothetical protein
MRMLPSLLIGLVGLTACKTANFKGATGARGKVNSPSTINSVDTVENPVMPGINGGSTVSTNPDGSSTTTTIAPDGTVTTSVKSPDGTTTAETTKPDGSVTTATTHPNGSITTEGKNPDGTTTTSTKNPDGTVTSEVKKPDGTVITEVKKPDGTTIVVTKNPDGSTTTTTTTTTKDGTVIVVTKNPDGSTTTTTTTTKPDGTVTIVTKNPDGTTTTVTKNPSGTTPGKDPNEPIFVECPENPNHMLIGKLYTLPENSDKVPTFSAIQNRFQKEVCIKQLDVIDREFTQGFPGIPGLIEWFALDINWRVNVPEEGIYTFYVNSDDGSNLYIDGTLVVNNDGLHPHQEKQQTVKVTKGWHNFHMTWYQGPRYRIALELFWKRPGAANREYIPTSYFARPSR